MSFFRSTGLNSVLHYLTDILHPKYMILQAILLLPTVGGDALREGPVTPRFEYLSTRMYQIQHEVLIV
jgi:hypothetical protein